MIIIGFGGIFFKFIFILKKLVFLGLNDHCFELFFNFNQTIMLLVVPLSADHDKETREFATFFNETLGFCPNSVLTMQHLPAI